MLEDPDGVVLEMVLVSSVTGGDVAQCLGKWATYTCVTSASSILSAPQFTNI